MDTTALEGGFADAPRDAARAFRVAMQVLARPGRIDTLTGAVPPAPLSVAAGTLVLTLADPTTPVHLAGALDVQAVRDWITFHTGAPLTGPQDAVFAIGHWDALVPVLTQMPIGTPEYPDRSTTVIVERDALDGPAVTLRGPGIKDSATLALPDTDAFARNAMLFPLGHDFFFTAGQAIAALPRSTKLEFA